MEQPRCSTAVSRMSTALALGGIAALAVSGWAQRAPHVSWEHLLTPYSQGEPLPDGFHIAAIRRGAGDVVVDVVHPADGAAVEVHILPRGRWPGVRESQSFGIAYETPRSPAPQREQITELLAETLRARDHGLPSPEVIPLGSSDPSRLPWWLAMLRGTRGTLLGALLLASVALHLLRTRALTLLTGALGIAAIGASLLGPPAVQADVGGRWLLPAAGLLLLVAGSGAQRPRPTRDIVWALALTALALTLRLAVGPWAPLHVNGYGPLFVLGAAGDPAAVAAYGPGYVELFGTVAALAPANPDWAVFAANACLSAGVAGVALLLARAAGVDRPAAVLAALAVALDPVALATATTESYFSALILLSITAACLVIVGTDRLARHAPGAALAALAAAALLVAQMIRTHPTGWLLAATVPFAALAAPRPLGARVAAAAAAALVTGGAVLVTSAGVLLDVIGNVRGGVLMHPPPPPPPSSLWPLLLALGAFVVLSRHRRLALPAGLAAAVLLLTRHSYGQGALWQQAYDRLYLTFPIIAAAAAIPSRLRRRWIAAALAVATAAAWLAVVPAWLRARTTDQLEYRWVRATLAELGPDCRVIYLASADKRALALPTYVGSPPRSAVAVNLGEPQTVEAALEPAPCRYYVRTSLCSSAEGRPLCDALESRFRLVPTARATHPAVPSSRFFPYDRPGVETVVFRVDA